VDGEASMMWFNKSSISGGGGAGIARRVLTSSVDASGGRFETQLSCVRMPYFSGGKLKARSSNMLKF
jgi:hypothetical protein